VKESKRNVKAIARNLAREENMMTVREETEAEEQKKTISTYYNKYGRQLLSYLRKGYCSSAGSMEVFVFSGTGFGQTSSWCKAKRMVTGGDSSSWNVYNSTTVSFHRGVN